MAGLDTSTKVRRTASPSPDIRVRAFRLHQSPEPESSNTSPTLGLSPGSPGAFVAEQSRLLRQASHSSNLSATPQGRRVENHDRGVDGMLDVDGTDLMGLASPESRSPGDGSEPWSSAIGRATVSGKSGRVIERLQSENDKLRREMKLYAARSDEEQRRGESIRSELDSLRTSNQNLEAICESNVSIINRKDRRLKDIEEELVQEKERRISAQTAQAQLVERTNKTLAEADRDLRLERDVAANAATQYEVLKGSLERMKLDYQRKVEQLSQNMSRLAKQLQSDEKRFMTIETLGEQIAFDQDKLDKSTRRINDTYEEYKQTSDDALGSFRARMASAENSNERAHQDMIDTTERMKQVMNIKRDFKGDFKD